MLLADLGADVIKVERPGVGDETRTWGPPFAGGEAAYYLAVNRGKRSIELDLADGRCRQAVERLIASSDVGVENFRSGGAERLGVGYEAVRELREDVVCCSITGFGSRREPADRAGYDFVAQAESGLTSVTGDSEGPPMKVGVALVDVLTGTHAAVGILAALAARERTGRGRRLEVSLLDTALAGLVNVAQAALLTVIEARRYGNAHPSIMPYEPFETSDGWIAVAAPNDGLWRAPCAACERPDLAQDDRLATDPGRVQYREELVASLAETFRTAPAAEWLDRLSRHGVPAGRSAGSQKRLRRRRPATRHRHRRSPHRWSPSSVTQPDSPSWGAGDTAPAAAAARSAHRRESPRDRNRARKRDAAQSAHERLGARGTTPSARL